MKSVFTMCLLLIVLSSSVYATDPLRAAKGLSFFKKFCTGGYFLKELPYKGARRLLDDAKLPGASSLAKMKAANLLSYYFNEFAVNYPRLTSGVKLIKIKDHLKFYKLDKWTPSGWTKRPIMDFSEAGKTNDLFGQIQKIGKELETPNGVFFNGEIKNADKIEALLKEIDVQEFRLEKMGKYLDGEISNYDFANMVINYYARELIRTDAAPRAYRELFLLAQKISKQSIVQDQELVNMAYDLYLHGITLAKGKFSNEVIARNLYILLNTDKEGKVKFLAKVSTQIEHGVEKTFDLLVKAFNQGDYFMNLTAKEAHQLAQDLLPLAIKMGKVNPSKGLKALSDIATSHLEKTIDGSVRSIMVVEKHRLSLKVQRDAITAIEDMIANPETGRIELIDNVVVRSLAKKVKEFKIWLEGF